jgi:hypothetical protein
MTHYGRPLPRRTCSILLHRALMLSGLHARTRLEALGPRKKAARSAAFSVSLMDRLLAKMTATVFAAEPGPGLADEAVIVVGIGRVTVAVVVGAVIIGV